VSSHFMNRDSQFVRGAVKHTITVTHLYAVHTDSCIICAVSQDCPSCERLGSVLLQNLF